MTQKHHPRIERLRKRMIQWNAKRVGSNGSCVLGIIVGTKGGDPKDRIQKKAGRNPLLWVWWGWSVMFTNLFDWEVEVRCSRKVVSFFHHHQTHICKDLATDSVDFSVFTAITRGQTFPSGWLGFCSCVLAAKNLWVSFISYHFHWNNGTICNSKIFPNKQLDHGHPSQGRETTRATSTWWEAWLLQITTVIIIRPTPLKLNSSPLKNDGWKTILSFWDCKCSGAMLI